MCTSFLRKSSSAGSGRSRATVLPVCVLRAFSIIAHLVRCERLSATLKQPIRAYPSRSSNVIFSLGGSRDEPRRLGDLTYRRQTEWCNRLLTVRTIEKWRMGFASLLASVACRVRERSCCSSRPVTTAEPSISKLERSNSYRQHPLAAPGDPPAGAC